MYVYPPPILYKYMSLSNVIPSRISKLGGPFTGIDVLREMIVEGRIWYSKPSSFNDPFEFQNIKCVGIKNHSYPPNQINKRNASLGESVLSRCGIICFCNNNTDIRMWAYYADGHRGICICFKCVPSPFFDNRLYKVMYDDDIIEFKIDLNDMDGDLFLRQVSTKAKCWEHEGEYRIVNPPSGIQEANGYGLKLFPADSIEGIIFGLKTSPEHKKEIIKIIEQKNVKINLYQASPVDSQLKIKIDKYE